jgi:DHA2 family lincomycin resistance protein-like MFS transporter
MVLSLGLACVFTPLFTSSLGSLPVRLYSHGSAIVSTVQQVAGAAGTALFISTMTAVALRRADAGASGEVALTAGIRVALVIGAALVTLGIPLAALIRKGSAETGEDVAARH